MSKNKKSILWGILFLLFFSSYVYGNNGEVILRDPFLSPLNSSPIHNEFNVFIKSLAELRLVGIVVTPSGNKAVVETPNKIAYFLEKGMSIGKNKEAVVEEITEQEVFISIINFFGNEKKDIFRMKIDHNEDHRQYPKDPWIDIFSSNIS
ncbi:MAG: hypothetical protein ACMUJM_18875 [bacterium]